MPTNQPDRTSTRSYRFALGLLWLLIVYGSLYPLTWNFEHPLDFVVLGPVGLIDVVENIVLFFPLGWLQAWYYHGQARQWHFFANSFLIALVVAVVLQWLQKYLPRSPALSDVIFNMLGHAAGWGVGLISRRSLNRMLQRHQNLRSADRFALLMTGVWLVSELFPLIPTFDVSSVADNVKSLWQQDAWQPRRMLLHLGTTVIGLEALAHLFRSASLARQARLLAGIAAVAILAGKFVVVGQSPGLAVVFGIAGGAMLWGWLDQAGENQRLTMVLAVAMGSYLLHAIWPWQWRDPPAAMSWLPFASSLSNSIEPVVTSLAFECLCFGAIIWSAVRMGALLGGLTLCTALMAFAGEWAQRYIPTRTPEITSAFLALGMGWLVSALYQTGIDRNKGSIDD